MATKKPMKFRGGGKIKGYYQGEVVTGDDSLPYGTEGAGNIYARNGAINRDTIARNTAAMRRAVANDEESVSPLAARNAQLQEKNTPNLNPDSALSIDDAYMKRLEAKRVANEFNQDTRQDVRDALSGKRPPAQEFTQLPPQKRTFQDNISNKVAKTVSSTGSGNRDLEATKSRGSQPTADNSIPPASTSSYKAPVTEEKSTLRKNFPGMASIYDYYASPSTAQGVKDNLANSAMALTPLTGGASKVATEFAMGNRARQAAQTANTARRAEEGFSPAEALAARSAQAETKATQAAAKKAGKTTKDKTGRTKSEVEDNDPFLPKTPKTGKAPSVKYETDEPMDISFGYKRGGAVKKFAKGGSVSSASSRADGIAIRGKTKGTISKMCGGGMTKGRK